MDKTVERFADWDNLVWAFRKAEYLHRTLYDVADDFDQSHFEFFLRDELDKIRSNFLAREYQTSPLRLMPIPKKPKNGDPRLRQFFQVAFRDQVAWIAILNVIGPALDISMPPWVYGYRLYRSPFPVSSSAHPERLLASYPRSKDLLYREFKDSWPLYRRHVEKATRLARAATKGRFVSEPEPRAIHREYVPSSVQSSFWRRQGIRPLNSYLASLDLKHFYPSIALDSVKRNLLTHCAAYRDDHDVQTLIDALLHFKVDVSGASPEMRLACEPPCSTGLLDGLPTGLWVSGFLSNVAMLDVDLIVDRESISQKIAHFRYIDDHTFVASSDSQLWNWILWYRRLLEDNRLSINLEKTVPPVLGKALATDNLSCPEIEPIRSDEVSIRAFVEISAIDREDFGILTPEDQQQRLEQLKALLIEELPKAERDTGSRRAFAASRIANLAPWLSRETTARPKFIEDSAALHRRILALKRSSKEAAISGGVAQDLEKEILQLERRLNQTNRRERQVVAERNSSEFSFLFRAFQKELEKPAVLQALFTFCCSTGYSGIATLIRGLASARNTPQGSYLVALAVRMLSKSILRATKIILDDTSLRFRRLSAEAFLANVTTLSRRDLIFGSAELPYVQSMELFKLALATANEALVERGLSNELVRRLRMTASRFEAVPWSLVPGGAARSRWPVWAFWAERHLGLATRTSPGPVWSRIARRLDASHPADWHLLQLYPRHQVRLLAILDSRRSLWRGEDGGWLWEAITFAGLAAKQLIGAARSSPVIADVLLDHPENAMMELGDWVRVMAEKAEASPFDPRTSEWTALEIFGRVARSVRTTRMAGRNLVHTNISVDRLSADLDEVDNRALASWGSWRSYAKSSLRVEIKSGEVTDYRCVSDSESQEALRADLFPTLGLLLLGLLRLDFAFPALWNLNGQRDARLGSIFQQYVRDLSISSSTASMLDFCLAPRHKERRLKRRLTMAISRENAVSLTADPDLDTLVDACDQAQAILERFQGGSFIYEPRQVIPVDAHQILLTRYQGRPGRRNET
jgi:hypothetical protein